jgi:ribosomal protein S18 acetylase RimI-like enzyme
MTTGITMRAANRAETEAILAFWRESAYGASPTDDAESIEALQACDPDALILAVDGGRIVGSIIAGWDGWRANLYRLAVLPEYRRRGLGAQLVFEAEQRFRSIGARRIGALVERDNTRAQAFWAAQGYAVAESQERYIKDFDEG